MINFLTKYGLMLMVPEAESLDGLCNAENTFRYHSL